MLSKYLEKLKSVNPKKYLVVLASLGVAGAGINSGLNKPVEVPKDKIVAVSKVLSPTQSQRDNYLNPGITCCSSSNSMYLNFYRPLLERGTDFVSDDTYIGSVYKRGRSQDHYIHDQALSAYGLDTVWRDDGDIDRIIRLTTQGFPTTVNILHRGKVGNSGVGRLAGGHCVLIRRYNSETKKFTVADPWGKLSNNYASKGIEDGNYEMSLAEFKVRHQGGYRILKEAQAKRLGLDKQ
jgi:hypothetical protein